METNPIRWPFLLLKQRKCVRSKPSSRPTPSEQKKTSIEFSLTSLGDIDYSLTVLCNILKVTSSPVNAIAECIKFSFDFLTKSNKIDNNKQKPTNKNFLKRNLTSLIRNERR